MFFYVTDALKSFPRHRSPSQSPNGNIRP